MTDTPTVPTGGEPLEWQRFLVELRFPSRRLSCIDVLRSISCGLIGKEGLLPDASLKVGFLDSATQGDAAPKGVEAPDGSSWETVEIKLRTPNTAVALLHHRHVGVACAACEIIALRSLGDAPTHEKLWEAIKAFGAAQFGRGHSKLGTDEREAFNQEYDATVDKLMRLTDWLRSPTTGEADNSTSERATGEQGKENGDV